jgi:hypothetical protein
VPGVPPLAVKLIAPVEAELQATLLVAETMVIKEGCVIATVLVLTQLFVPRAVSV